MSSHRSCRGLLAFVLEGNNSVGVHMPGSWLDLIKRKLKKILLQKIKGDSVNCTHKKTNKKTQKYLCELKSSVRQQRCDPIGTFRHVTVKLRRRLNCVLGHVLVDVLYSSLKNRKYQFTSSLTIIRKQLKIPWCYLEVD